jgi:hypothetical protein
MSDQHVKEVEAFLAKEFETPFKFSGFINGNNKVKYRFTPDPNPDLPYLPVAGTLESLQEAINEE